MLLMVAQLTLLMHKADLEAHASGETCELCLHAASLDHGAPAAPLIHVDMAVAIAPPLPAATPLLWHPSHHFSARAPPRTSLI